MAIEETSSNKKSEKGLSNDTIKIDPDDIGESSTTEAPPLLVDATDPSSPLSASSNSATTTTSSKKKRRKKAAKKLDIGSIIRELIGCKEHGNKYFQAKEYQAAAKAYQQGLKLLGDDDNDKNDMDDDDDNNDDAKANVTEIISLESALRANRAMALLKLNDFEQAERETNRALQIDPNNLKVWYRRALAREGKSLELTTPSNVGNDPTAITNNNGTTIRALILLEQAQSDVQYCLSALEQSNNNNNNNNNNTPLTKKERAEQQSMKEASQVVLKRVQQHLSKWRQQPSSTTSTTPVTTASSSSASLSTSADTTGSREVSDNKNPTDPLPSTTPPQLERSNGEGRGRSEAPSANAGSLSSSSPQRRPHPPILIERPSPEQQRRDIFRLLIGRQAVVLKQQPHQPSLYALDGEAFCLVEWSWWSAWCQHVNFFYNQQPQQSKLVLKILPPGASIPSYKTKTTRRGNDDDDETDTDTDDDDDEDDEDTSQFQRTTTNNTTRRRRRAPGWMDNSKLFLFVPPSTDAPTQQSQPPLDFYQQWYLHSLHGTNTATPPSPSQRDDKTTAPLHQLWLRPTLVRGHHYELVPREVYSALRDWYGEVTPSICRRATIVESSVMSDNNDAYATAPPKVVIDLYPERSNRHRQLDPSLHDPQEDPPLPQPPSSSHHYYCAGCRAPYARSRCKQCLSVYYCDRTCQESNWPYHRLECKRLAAARMQNDHDDNNDDPLGNLVSQRSLQSSGGGRVGLNNLGNTCFMNSALQCLSHATPLTRHFLSNRFQADLNAGNPLGTGGKLAMAYASVLRDLWMMGSNNTKALATSMAHLSTSPTALKRAIAAFAPRFAGCSQHDAQEFLAYLLDGLHEDLNRIRRAPYVEMPDVSKEPNMAVAGARVWDAHQRRNDSLVLDTFYGQFQSTCVCPKCHQVSVSFDAFNHISLEIPQPNQNLLLRRIIPIPLFRAPPKNNNGTAATNPANVLPQRYGVMVLRQGTTMADVKLALSDLCGISPDQLAICEVYDHCIYDIFPDDKPVQSVRANDSLAAYEIDAYTNKSVHVVVNQIKVTKNPMQPNMVQPQDGDVAAPDPVHDETRELFAYPILTSFGSSLTCRQVWELMWRHVRHCVMGKEGNPNELSPQLTVEEQRLQQTLQIRLVENNGKPLAVFKPSSASDGEEQPQFEDHDDNGDDDRDDDHRYSLLPRFLDTPLSNFLGPDCTEQFLYMSLEWSDVDNGADVPSEADQTSSRRVLDEEQFLAFEDHPSLNDAIQRHQALNPTTKSVTLDQCFETFTRPERLDEHNKWYCANCKEHVSAMKTMQLWRLPNILVVHLKRFEFKHGLRRDKLDTLVEFPLEDLDMSKHCALYNKKGGDNGNDSFVIDDQVPAIYDLFAVTNHYGRMGFGHYTAFARQWDELGMSPEWNLFDDSSVQSVGDGRGNQGKLPGVVSAAAYVLFYRRRIFS